LHLLSAVPPTSISSRGCSFDSLWSLLSKPSLSRTNIAARPAAQNRVNPRLSGTRLGRARSHTIALHPSEPNRPAGRSR